MVKQKPLAVMMSKRANVFYLEHVKVVQKDNRVVYLTQDSKNNLGQFFNIPDKNTCFILLGKGSSITDAAARLLAESSVSVGFCGSGASPLFSSVSPVFLTSESEYRPTEYGQGWMKLWLNESNRLNTAKEFLGQRATNCVQRWSENAALSSKKVSIPPALVDDFLVRIDKSTSTTDLLLAEAWWAKNLYRLLSLGLRVEFLRDEGQGKSVTPNDRVNSFLDHGNYIAYGYAVTVLVTLGIPFFLPVLHGKTRRGALVFDVADLFKDAIVMPLAFELGVKNTTDQNFRIELIKRCQQADVLDKLFDFIKTIALKNQ